MNSDLLNDYNLRALLGLLAINLLILLWLGRAFFIGISSKTSRVFLWSLLAVCGIVCLMVVLHPGFAQ